MTVINPEFRLAASTHTGTVALKVADLSKQIVFYQDVIGLHLLKREEKVASLGINKTPLLILREIDNPLPLTRKTGLFHVAFRMPTRKDLGNALIHYLQTKAPIIGASDHGYSEAIYLTDPEGNGIEVYRDKPMTDWDIREDGEIVGITIEMDAQGVVDAADGNWQGFPNQSDVGHVHLKVANLQITEKFYTEVLGLSLKNNFGQHAKFFATGKYHHHIGSNVWNGRNLPAMAENDLGLDYYTFFVTSSNELERIEQHLVEQKTIFEKETVGTIWLSDPNGIKIKFQTVKD